MASSENSCDSDSQENFSIEDCEALLEFPYHEYERQVKREVETESERSGTILHDGSNTNQSSQVSLNKQDVIDYNSRSFQEDRLGNNLSLQFKMKSMLAKLSLALQKNLEKQGELNEDIKICEKEITEEKICLAKPISIFASPYFRDIRGMKPPDNPDTIEKLKRKDVTAYHRPPRPWTRAEKNKLIQGVAASALNVVLKPYKTKRDHYYSKLNDKNASDETIRNFKKQIISLEHIMKMESKRPLVELLKEAEGKMDWLAISATNLEGMKSEEECEFMWTNYLSNTVNKGDFSAEEDKNLQKLAIRYDEKNWDLIATKLNTNRTAIQCFERYQTTFNEALTKKYWTPEEDKLLLKVVDDLKIGNYIPWNTVCNYMEGRTRIQIVNRYDRAINKEIKRTPFTTEEDAMLLACHKKYGGSWIRMKEFLPGRPSYSIRERYVNTLDPFLKMGNWSKEEDLQLIALLKKHGYGKWGKISREMHGRTDNMCLVRARRLELFSKKLKKKRDKNGCAVLTPAAPSKTCLYRNNLLKEVRTAALNRLKRACRNIRFYIEDHIDLKTLDLSTISINTLRAIQRELLGINTRIDPDDSKYNAIYVPPEFQIKRKTKRKRPDNGIEDYATSGSDDDTAKNNVDESDIDDLSGSEDSESITLNTSEKSFVFEILDSYCKEAMSIFTTKSAPVYVNKKDSCQLEFFIEYLKERMLCQKLHEYEVINNEIAKEEYKNTVTDVIRYFIQAEPNADHLPVISPNYTTALALEAIETVRPRLRRSSTFIVHSETYVKYLLGHREEKPKCTKCKPNNNGLEEVEEMKQSMQVKNLIVDPYFEAAARAQCGIPSEDCKCEELSKSKQAFNLLQRRFFSLFLWPHLLSENELTEIQESMYLKENAGNMLMENKPNKYILQEIKNRKPKRKLGRPRKCEFKTMARDNKRRKLAKQERLKKTKVCLENDKNDVSKSYGVKTPAEKAVGVKTPVEKSVGVKTPVQKSVGVKAPVQKSIRVKAPVQKSIRVKAPVKKSIRVKTPVEKSVEVKTPVEKSVEVKTPVEKSVKVKTPGEKSVEVKIPVEKLVGVKTPVEKSVETPNKTNLRRSQRNSGHRKSYLH